MKRKGLLHLAAFIFVVGLAAAMAIVFVLIFKVKITNAITYDHKTDGIGLAYNTMLNLKYGSYQNTENFGSYILLGSNAPQEIKTFESSYFASGGTIYSIFTGQKCIDYFVRDISLRVIENPTRCNRNNEFIQMSIPIALPYNPAHPIKIVSLVTVK